MKGDLFSGIVTVLIYNLDFINTLATKDTISINLGSRLDVVSVQSAKTKGSPFVYLVS